MESVLEVASRIREFLGVPPDITPWDLMNSELIVALAALIVGSVLNRKLVRIQEKSDDDRLERELEAELETTTIQSSITEQEEPTARETSTETVAPSHRSVASSAQFPDVEADLEPMGRVMFSRASHFDRGASVISTIKELVDQRVKSVRDGRKRRKYENIGKRDYRLRVLALDNDGMLNPELVSKLLRAFELWRPYQRNVKEIPDGLVDELSSLEAQIESEFSRLN